MNPTRWVLVLVAVSGCVPAYSSPPPRTVEDFAGARGPYRISAVVSSQDIWIHLSPGVCRRFVVAAPAPPRLVGQYRCPYATAGVLVGLGLEGQPATPALTDRYGDVHFSIPDDVAASIPPETVARVIVGPVDAGEVALAPLVVAALNRARYEPPAPEPDPSYAPPRRPQPPEPAPPPPEVARTRRLSDDEVLALTTAVCLIKIGLAEKCDEQFGAAGCSVAKQYLSTGHVDPREVAKEAAIAAAVKDHEGIQLLLQGIEFFGCYGETEEKLRVLTVPVAN